MITTPEEWAVLTDAQRYRLLTDTQAECDNWRQHVHELNGRATAQRQQAVVSDLGPLPIPQCHGRTSSGLTWGLYVDGKCATCGAPVRNAA